MFSSRRYILQVRDKSKSIIGSGLKRSHTNKQPFSSLTSSYLQSTRNENQQNAYPPRMNMSNRFKSSSALSPEEDDDLLSVPFDEEGNAAALEESITFPDTSSEDAKPILMNAGIHAIGYLSKVLNARVYEAAIETDLQLAKNLSAVSTHIISTSFFGLYYSMLCWKSQKIL